MHTSPVIAAGLALALAACSSAAPAASVSPAQCNRAGTAAQQVAAIATFYNGVSTTMGIITADDQIAADSSVTGSEASDLAAITAAGTSSPARLARPLASLGADYQALQADVSDSASPAQVSQEAAAVLGDQRRIEDVCGR